MTDHRHALVGDAGRRRHRKAPWLVGSRRVHGRDLAGGPVRRCREPTLPGRRRRPAARAVPARGSRPRTAHRGTPSTGSGITATGLNLTAGPPAYEIAVDPAVIALQSFVHVTPNPFGTHARVLRRRHRRRDHRPPRRHLRLAGRAAQHAWGVRHVTVTPAPNPGAGNLLGEITPTAPSQTAATPTSAVCATSVGGPLALTPGQQAKILPSGLAAAPSEAPSTVKLAIAAGNQLISKPYIWGGGHGVPLSQLDSGVRLLGRDQLHPARRRRARAVRRGLHAARELRPAGPGSMDHRVRELGPRVHRRRRDRDEHRLVRAGQPDRPRQRTPVAARVHDHSPVRGRPVRRLRATPPRKASDHAPSARCSLLSRRSPRPCSPAAGSLTRTRARTPPRRRRRAPPPRPHQRRPRTGAWRHDPRRRARAQSRLSAGAARPTPQAALERYAHLYVNWTADSVAAVQRELASLSEGQARAQALQAAASYTRDQTLTQSGVANSGHLVAITPSLTTPEQWVLVTSEQTTGKGDYSGLPQRCMSSTRKSLGPRKAGS